METQAWLVSKYSSNMETHAFCFFFLVSNKMVVRTTFSIPWSQRGGCCFQFMGHSAAGRASDLPALWPPACILGLALFSPAAKTQ